LLAKGLSQPTSSLPVTPLSRASPLPQGFAADTDFVPDNHQLWERACSRRGPSQPTSSLPVTPLSRASPLPQGICGEHRFCARQPSTVGAGLLAKGASQPTSSLPLTPLSRASPLPQGFAADTDFVPDNHQLWERACSRRGPHSQHLLCLLHRFREQARSHKGLRRTQILCPTTINYGSGLAREGALTANIFSACYTAFASKPAPTRVCGGHRFCGHQRSTVGASLLAMASNLAPQIPICLDPSPTPGLL